VHLGSAGVIAYFSPDGFRVGVELVPSGRVSSIQPVHEIHHAAPQRPREVREMCQNLHAAAVGSAFPPQRLPLVPGLFRHADNPGALRHGQAASDPHGAESLDYANREFLAAVFRILLFAGDAFDWVDFTGHWGALLWFHWCYWVGLVPLDRV